MFFIEFTCKFSLSIRLACKTRDDTSAPDTNLEQYDKIKLLVYRILKSYIYQQYFVHIKLVLNQN